MGFNDFWINNNGKKEQLNNVKHGVRKDQVDKKFHNLFDAYDTNGDGTLEDSELEGIFSSLSSFSGADKTLDAKENNAFSSVFSDITGLKDADFMGFVKSISSAGQDIVESKTTEEEDGGKIIETTYRDGTKETIAYYPNGDYKYRHTEKHTVHSTVSYIVDGREYTEAQLETKIRKDYSEYKKRVSVKNGDSRTSSFVMSYKSYKSEWQEQRKVIPHTNSISTDIDNLELSDYAKLDISVRDFLLSHFVETHKSVQSGLDTMGFFDSIGAVINAGGGESLTACKNLYNKYFGDGSEEDYQNFKNLIESFKPSYDRSKEVSENLALMQTHPYLYFKEFEKNIPDYDIESGFRFQQTTEQYQNAQILQRRLEILNRAMSEISSYEVEQYGLNGISSSSEGLDSGLHFKKIMDLLIEYFDGDVDAANMLSDDVIDNPDKTIKAVKDLYDETEKMYNSVLCWREEQLDDNYDSDGIHRNGSVLHSEGLTFDQVKENYQKQYKEIYGVDFVPETLEERISDAKATGGMAKLAAITAISILVTRSPMMVNISAAAGGAEASGVAANMIRQLTSYAMRKGLSESAARMVVQQGVQFAMTNGTLATDVGLTLLNQVTSKRGVDLEELTEGAKGSAKYIFFGSYIGAPLAQAVSKQLGKIGAASKLFDGGTKSMQGAIQTTSITGDKLVQNFMKGGNKLLTIGGAFITDVGAFTGLETVTDGVNPLEALGEQGEMLGKLKIMNHFIEYMLGGRVHASMNKAKMDAAIERSGVKNWEIKEIKSPSGTIYEVEAGKGLPLIRVADKNQLTTLMMERVAANYKPAEAKENDRAENIDVTSEPVHSADQSFQTTPTQGASGNNSRPRKILSGFGIKDTAEVIAADKKTETPKLNEEKSNSVKIEPAIPAGQWEHNLSEEALKEKGVVGKTWEQKSAKLEAERLTRVDALNKMCIFTLNTNAERLEKLLYQLDVKDTDKINEIKERIEKCATQEEKVYFTTLLDNRLNPSVFGKCTPEQIAAEVNLLINHFVNVEAEISQSAENSGLNKGAVSHRIKSDTSTYDKLYNFMKDKAEKSEKEGKPVTVTLMDALTDVRDMYGMRGVISAGNYSDKPNVRAKIELAEKASAPEEKRQILLDAAREAAEYQTEDLLTTITRQIVLQSQEKSGLEGVRMVNYVSANGVPTFSETQLWELFRTAEEVGINKEHINLIEVKLNEEGVPVAAKDVFTKEVLDSRKYTSKSQNGYTAFQMNFRTKEGDWLEFQARDKYTNEFAEAEHFIYDILTDKDIIGRYPELRDLYDQLRMVLDETNMPKDVLKAYRKTYISDYYAYCRAKSVGIDLGEPNLQTYAAKIGKKLGIPDLKLDPRLDAKNLMLLHDIGEKVKKEGLPVEEALDLYKTQVEAGSKVSNQPEVKIDFTEINGKRNLSLTKLILELKPNEPQEVVNVLSEILPKLSDFYHNKLYEGLRELPKDRILKRLTEIRDDADGDRVDFRYSETKDRFCRDENGEFNAEKTALLNRLKEAVEEKEEEGNGFGGFVLTTDDIQSVTAALVEKGKFNPVYVDYACSVIKYMGIDEVISMTDFMRPEDFADFIKKHKGSDKVDVLRRMKDCVSEYDKAEADFLFDVKKRLEEEDLELDWNAARAAHLIYTNPEFKNNMELNDIVELIQKGNVTEYGLIKLHKLIKGKNIKCRNIAALASLVETKPDRVSACLNLIENTDFSNKGIEIDIERNQIKIGDAKKTEKTFAKVIKREKSDINFDFYDIDTLEKVGSNKFKSKATSIKYGKSADCEVAYIKRETQEHDYRTNTVVNSTVKGNTLLVSMKIKEQNIQHFDENGNLLFTEVWEASKTRKNTFEIYEQYPDGRKIIISTAEKTPAGEIIVEKTLQSADGTKTNYVYVEGEGGSSLRNYEIKDNDGNMLSHVQKIKYYDTDNYDTKTQTIKFDAKTGETTIIDNRYHVDYENDAFIITDKNKTTLEIKIDDLVDGTRSDKKYFAKILKQIPAEDIVLMRAMGIKLKYKSTYIGNAHYCGSEIVFGPSIKECDKVFVFLHEFNHAKDHKLNSAAAKIGEKTYGDLSYEEEFQAVYQSELEAFRKKAPDIYEKYLSYFTTSDSKEDAHRPLEEMVAEAGAIQNTELSNSLNYRTQLLQKEFPKTISYLTDRIGQTQTKIVENVFKTVGAKSKGKSKINRPYDTEKPLSEQYPEFYKKLQAKYAGSSVDMSKTIDDLLKCYAHDAQMAEYLVFEVGMDYLTTRRMASLVAHGHKDAYLKMKDSGVFELIRDGKIDKNILDDVGNNSYLSDAVLSDIAKIRDGKGVVTVVPNGAKSSDISKYVSNGEVAEINGKLYANNNGKPFEIKLTKEKFEQLFPLVQRFNASQGKLGNCGFVSTLSGFMDSPEGRVDLYKLFSQEGNDIFVQFPNTKQVIRFEGGKPANVGNARVSGVDGFALIEQAYIIEKHNKYKFGHRETNAKMLEKHPKWFSNIEGVHNEDVVFKITGFDTGFFSVITSKDFWNEMGSAFTWKEIKAAYGHDSALKAYRRKKEIKLIEQYANDKSKVFYVGTRPVDNAWTEELISYDYNLYSNHAYAVKGYDKQIGMVKITNPWACGVVTEVPIDYFLDNISYYGCQNLDGTHVK